MEKEKNRGITLIALIITIIIMLILVATSISIVINSGLFEAAGKAVKDTRTAQEKEQKLAGGMINIDGKTYASIDDYLAGNEYVHEHTWSEWVITKEATETESGEKERTCSECQTKEKITYVKNLIIGAPISYHEYIGEDGNPLSTMPSYASPKEKTGDSEDQEFLVTDNSGIEWIVLGEENGQIKITTKNVIKPRQKDRYSLRGRNGYANGVEELQKIGSIYGKGKYADTSKYTVEIEGTEEKTGGRSFQKEDLGYEACTREAAYTYALEQHEGDTEAKVYRYEVGTEIDGTSTIGGRHTKFEYMNLDANPNKIEATEDADKTWNSLNSSNPYVTIYSYKYGGNKTLSGVVCKSNINYWLAARSTYSNENYGYSHVFLMSLCYGSSGNLGSQVLYESTGGDVILDQIGFRPVVYLKSNVKLAYNEVSGYTVSY